MDEPTELLSAYASTISFGELTGEAVHGIERCMVDAMACALAAHRMEAVGIVRELAGTATASPPAHVLFSGEATTPDLAAYVNSYMVGYLDWNDTYLASHGGHPSDTIPAVLAVGDALGASGRDTVLAMVVAYEVFCALADSEGLRVPGFGAPVIVAISSALGAGKLLGLDAAGMANAIALAMAGGLALSVPRDKPLSMWRAGAAANGARNGVFAARLAALGATGPQEPFLALAGGEAPALPPLGGRGVDFHTTRTHMKSFPGEYHAQAPLWAALQVRERMEPDDIAEVVVYTYAHAMRGIGSGASKWDVPDADTALHSLPYLIAVGLLDGVTPEAFTPERLRDRRTHELMRRVAVREEPELTRGYPGVIAARVEAVGKDGAKHVAEWGYPKGHARNAFSDEELDAKFRRCAEGLLSTGAQEAVLGRLWALEREGDVRSLVRALRV